MSVLEAPPDEGGDDRRPDVEARRQGEFEVDDDELKRFIETGDVTPKSEDLVLKPELMGDQAPNRKEYRQHVIGIDSGRLSVHAVMPAHPARMPDGTLLFTFGRRDQRLVKDAGRRAVASADLLTPKW